ncbi:MAG: Crp/Fnr family transcriptional regulator [Pseudomonadota bacterium]
MQKRVPKTVEDYAAMLEANALFNGLARETLRRLAATMRSVHVDGGKVLFRQGDTAQGCYCVASGVLKVSICSAGEDDEMAETLLAILGRGDVIGEMALVDRLPRSATITALKDTELGLISTADFERIADADTEIYRHLLRVLSARLRTSNETKAQERKRMCERIALVLVRLGEAFGEPLPDGRILIRQKFSQAQLGQMAGCARENVNRQLNAFKREALISKISSYYCIHDCEALLAHARQ